jgi:hypothetical protein
LYSCCLWLSLLRRGQFQTSSQPCEMHRNPEYLRNSPNQPFTSEHFSTNFFQLTAPTSPRSKRFTICKHHRASLPQRHLHHHTSGVPAQNTPTSHHHQIRPPFSFLSFITDFCFEIQEKKRDHGYDYLHADDDRIGPPSSLAF